MNSTGRYTHTIIWPIIYWPDEYYTSIGHPRYMATHPLWLNIFAYSFWVVSDISPSILSISYIHKDMCALFICFKWFTKQLTNLQFYVCAYPYTSLICKLLFSQVVSLFNPWKIFSSAIIMMMMKKMIMKMMMKSYNIWYHSY